MIDMSEYIRIIKYHEENKISTNQRSLYWKNANVSVKL
jgi:hypothetical protein